MHWRAQAFADPYRGIGDEPIGRPRIEWGRLLAAAANGIAVAPTTSAAPVAMDRKSRREGSAAEIVVTRLTLFRLAGHTPSALRTAPGRSVRRRRARLIRPGGDQRRRNPAAFYWHPYRESARVSTSAPCNAPPSGAGSCFGSHFAARESRESAAESNQFPSAADRSRPCVSPSTNRTFPRTREQSFACVRASASKRTSSNLQASRRPTAPFAVPAWIISTR